MTDTQAKARSEKAEMEHFNSLESESGNNRVTFRKDLCDHPDYRLMRTGIDLFVSLENKNILILGSGVAKEAWYLADKADYVIATDIAVNRLKVANRSSQSYPFHDKISFSAMSGYRMGLKSNSIDCIYGHASLHHLDITLAGPELSRVLKPGGTAVFTEPFDHNPFLRFARNHLPYPDKHRLPDEKAMTYKDLYDLGTYFDNTFVKEAEFTSMIGRLIKNDTLVDNLYKLDKFLIRVFPFLKRMCRVVIVKYTKGVKIT